jgi:hypothetical protein
MAGVKPLRKSKMSPKALRRVGVEADLERSSEFVNGSMEAASSVDLFTWWPRLLGVDDDGVEELSDKKDKKDQDKGVQPPILEGLDLAPFSPQPPSRLPVSALWLAVISCRAFVPSWFPPDSAERIHTQPRVWRTIEHNQRATGEGTSGEDHAAIINRILRAFDAVTGRCSAASNDGMGGAQGTTRKKGSLGP